MKGSLVARGEAPCAPETNTYCEARKRLALGVFSRLARKADDDLESQVSNDWTGKGRHCYLVDGTTVSLPDTTENRERFPQRKSQEPATRLIEAAHNLQAASLTLLERAKDHRFEMAKQYVAVNRFDTLSQTD
jgi:hypothetical protein